MAQKDWIIIFDNAHPEIDYEVDYFPDTPGGVMIINGRQPQLKAKAKGSVKRVLVLHPLAERAGHSHFMRMLATSEDERVGHEDESKLVEDIVKDLGGSPLAIEFAVSRIRKWGRQTPLQDRLKQYRRYWDNLMMGRYSREISRIQSKDFQQIFDLLEKMSHTQEDELTLLQLLSCLGPEPLNTSLLEASWNNWKTAQSQQGLDYSSYPLVLKDHEPKTFESHIIQEAISRLDDLSFINVTLHGGNSKITINTFVKECILLHMNSRSIHFSRTSCSALTMLVQSISWEDDLDQRTLPTQMLPHLRVIVDKHVTSISFCAALYESDGPEAGLDAALKAGRVYFQGGHVEKAKSIQECVIEKARNTLGVYQTVTLRAMSEIATAYMILDSPDKALKMREEAFQVRETISQRQLLFSFVLRCSLRNLCYAVVSSHWPTRRTIIPDFCGSPFEDTLKRVRIAWIIRANQKNSDVVQKNLLAHKQISMNLADSLAALPSLEQREKALQIRRNVAFQRILTIRKSSQPSTLEDLQRRIEATRKVASSLHDLRQFRNSFLLRKKIYNLWREKEYEKHSKYSVLALRIAGELAESYTDLGSDAAALKLSENLLNTLVNQMCFPDSHLQVILAQRDLGHRYEVAGNLLSAQDLYEKVEEKLVKLFRPYHHLTFEAAENVVLIKDRLRNPAAALQKQRAVIREKSRRYAPWSEDILCSLELAVSILVKADFLAYLAPKLLYYVINTRIQRHHENEDSLFNSLNNLLNCLTNSDEGHYSHNEETGCKLCHYAQNLRSKVLRRQASRPNYGMDHTDFLLTMSGLAKDYDAQCQFHMRPEEDSWSSRDSNYVKASISISERDPTDTATRYSGESHYRELEEELLDEWKLYLQDDSLDEGVFKLLASNNTPHPIVSIHDGSHVSSLKDLRTRSLQLREYILQKVIANSRVVTIKGQDLEGKGPENRLVRQAQAKLEDSRSLYDSEPGSNGRYGTKKVSKWLEDLESDFEDFETGSPVWPASPDVPAGG